jgi:hypothetical protein
MIVECQETVDYCASIVLSPTLTLAKLLLIYVFFLESENCIIKHPTKCNSIASVPLIASIWA